MKHAENRNYRFTLHTLRWLFPLLMCIVTAMSAQSQTLHALLVIMDADPDVGSAMQTNAEDIGHFLTQIEENTGLQVKIKMLLSSQNQARKSELTTWLNTREIASEDVLFVYFSGKGALTALTEHLYLQDGGITHTDLAKKVRGTGTGRLTLLITDRCDMVVAETDTDTHRHAHPSPAMLESLFKKHEGFLHLTSATGQEPGWADANGGFLTHALLHTIQSEPEPASWRDIVYKTGTHTTAAFEAIYPDFADNLKDDLQARGIRGQTPKPYRLPTVSGTLLPASDNQLWNLKNIEASFTVNFETDKRVYLIDELVIHHVEVRERAYAFIFNWGTSGKFHIAFPNKFDDENLLVPGKGYLIPPNGADYEFVVSPPPGTERVKILALRKAEDSNAIKRMIAAATENRTESKSDPLQDDSAQSKRDALQLQERIVKYIGQLDPRDWSENHTTTKVKLPIPPEDDDFREPDDEKGTRADELPKDGDLTKPGEVDAPNSARHPNPVDIFFFKEGEYGSYAYLAQLMDPEDQDAAEVEVHIFNEMLREKYAEKLPQAWLIRERLEPIEGWGNRTLMLSFYRSKEWIFTTDVVMHQDHYLLPERLNGNGDLIQGEREVSFGEVRIPIPVAFENEN